MQIGSVPNPHDWAQWSRAEALLEPARKLGNFERVIDPDEVLWVAMDGDELLGCATAWLGDGFVEVKLVGGRDHRRWIREMDEVIGACSREAGAARLQAFGRSGWRRALSGLGWEVKGEVDGMTVYHKEL